MLGFCEVCGEPIKEGGKCPHGHSSLTPEPPEPWPGWRSEEPPPKPGNDVGALPPADRLRRLLGSGIEFLVYVLAIPVMSLSVGLGCLIFLVLLSLILLRDFNAGAFNIAKRVSHMRVVHWKSGQPASNFQCFLRNVYYIGLLPVAVVPVLGLGPWFFFVLFVTIDIAIIIASPRGRRFGDFLAGTQVVERKG